MTDCSTLRCTCKKHNIECSPACGNCRGSGCTNILQLPCGDDEDDDKKLLRTYKCNSVDCFVSNMCLIYYSRHGAMMKMVILRTYKCNSLHCFDSNVCLTYYSCHVAMMNMMILRTYKCNSLHCFDSNMCLTMYTMWFSIMFIYRLSDVELWRVAKDR